MNSFIRVLSLVFVCIAMQGCRTPVRMVGKTIGYPLHDKFTLKGKLNPEEMILDTNMVYVQTVKTVPGGNVRYRILRLWPDGRCFMGATLFSSIDHNTVELLRIGNPGYYVVNSDNIIIETFSREYSGSYAVSRGRLIRNSEDDVRIRIMETRYRGGFSLSMVRTYRYPHFGSQGRREYGDFVPMDFGPLRSVPTWGGDL
jgi:hypothetical protein